MEKEFSKEEMVKEAVEEAKKAAKEQQTEICLLYTSPSPRDA